MVSEYGTIRTVGAVLLLKCGMMLRVLLLLLVPRLVLEVVHHWHAPPTWSAIDAAMLPLLVALIKHSVQGMRSGLGIGRS